MKSLTGSENPFNNHLQNPTTADDFGPEYLYRKKVDLEGRIVRGYFKMLKTIGAYKESTDLNIYIFYISGWNCTRLP
jgi:hypothetical protein